MEEEIKQPETETIEEAEAEAEAVEEAEDPEDSE